MIKKKTISADDLFVDLKKIATAFNKGAVAELSQDTGSLCITQIVCPITHENTCNATVSKAQVCCAITQTEECMLTRDCESIVYCAESKGRACMQTQYCQIATEARGCDI